MPMTRSPTSQGDPSGPGNQDSWSSHLVVSLSLRQLSTSPPVFSLVLSSSLQTSLVLLLLSLAGLLWGELACFLLPSTPPHPLKSIRFELSGMLSQLPLIHQLSIFQNFVDVAHLLCDHRCFLRSCGCVDILFCYHRLGEGPEPSRCMCFGLPA